MRTPHLPQRHQGERDQRRTEQHARENLRERQVARNAHDEPRRRQIERGSGERGPDEQELQRLAARIAQRKSRKGE